MRQSVDDRTPSQPFQWYYRLSPVDFAPRQLEHSMRRWVKYILAAVATLASIPLTFYLALMLLMKMVESEYASGARTSTDGDSVMIPAVGITVTWVLVLVIGWLGVLIWMRFRRRHP